MSGTSTFQTKGANQQKEQKKTMVCESLLLHTMSSVVLRDDRFRASSQSPQLFGLAIPRCFGVKWHSYTQLLVSRGSVFNDVDDLVAAGSG